MVMKEVTGLRGTGAEGVVATIVGAMTAGVTIVVVLTEVEEEEDHPLVWGKSESLPPLQVPFM